MPDPVVSVIVPVHNNASLLRHCIDSVCRQSMADFELILVDDASSDETPGVIADIDAHDERAVTLRLDRQYGASYARNRGIERARGDYLIFVDADDHWKHNEVLAELLRSARAASAELVTFGFERLDMQGCSLGACTDPAAEFNPARDNNWRIRYNPWAKFIKRRFVERHALRFDETLRWGEDAVFAVALYCHANRVVNLDRVFYCYRFNPAGMARREWSPDRLRETLGWFSSAIDVASDSRLAHRRPEVLASVAVERLQMFAARLGPLAAQRLDREAFASHVDAWARCFEAIDRGTMDAMIAASPRSSLLRGLLERILLRDSHGLRLVLAGEGH